MQFQPIYKLTGNQQGIFLDGVPLHKCDLSRLPKRTLSHLLRAAEVWVTMDENDWVSPVPHASNDIPKRVEFEMNMALSNPCSLNKYSPDQPRDGNGRWTNTNATSPHSSENQGGHSTTHKPYPHHWDAKVDKYVSAYNAKYGFKLGDAEYLDTNLVKAMIKQESGYDLKAYNADPMQVNNPDDWVDEKAKYGLTAGVAPGSDLSIQAGIGWLRYKAYGRKHMGDPLKFKGWPQAVHDYNGGGNPNYVKEVYEKYNIPIQHE